MCTPVSGLNLAGAQQPTPLKFDLGPWKFSDSYWNFVYFIYKVIFGASRIFSWLL